MNVQNNTKSSPGQHQVVLKGNARLPWKGFARQHQMTPQNNSLLPPRNYFEFTQRQAMFPQPYNLIRWGWESNPNSPWLVSYVTMVPHHGGPSMGFAWARWILPKGHVIYLQLMEVNILIDVLGHFASHQAHVYHVLTKSHLGFNYFLTSIWFVVSPKCSSQKES
jgi:hypothetical protein